MQSIRAGPEEDGRVLSRRIGRGCKNTLIRLIELIKFLVGVLAGDDGLLADGGEDCDDDGGVFLAEL